MKELIKDPILIFGLINSLLLLIVSPEHAIALGGFLLMVGAFYVYMGEIFYSILVYTVADMCWLVNAYSHGDIFGAVAVTVGILAGSSAVYKMQIGIFRKNIKNKD